MLKEKLLKKLIEISNAIDNDYKSSNIGVLSGGSGIALFNYYYARFINSKERYDEGEKLLVWCTDKVNNGEIVSTFCSGIAGYGWVLEHLAINGFIDLDTSEILEDVDEYLYNCMKFDFFADNYDFLHGGIGYGYYFLKRFEQEKEIIKRKEIEIYLLEIIGFIIEKAETKDDVSKWLSILDYNTGLKGYNLGLSHGIPSIIAFLTKLNSLPEFKHLTEKILQSALNFVVNHSYTNFEEKNDETVYCIFPNSIFTEESDITKNVDKQKSRLGWCYGDLGIAVSIWNASTSLKNEALKSFALNIFHHASKRTDKDETLVYDACICHGAFGNAKIFHNIYLETKIKSFYEASVFWMNEGLEMCNMKDGYAGYKQYVPNKNGEVKWRNQGDLLDGIAGIGLVIIDFLSNEKSNWDECLMLS